MISNEELERQLMMLDEIAYVSVAGDGYHYQVTIVSDAFLDKSKVARQQWVYALLKEYILSGSLHAINMKTWTKAEWEKQHG